MIDSLTRRRIWQDISKCRLLTQIFRSFTAQKNKDNNFFVSKYINLQVRQLINCLVHLKDVHATKFDSHSFL